MPVVPGLAVTIPAGVRYYRTTPAAYRRGGVRAHRRIVNGAGAVKSRHGARYNYPGVCTVYLAEDVETCLAERLFYFHRETLEELDRLHLTGFAPPPFQRRVVLWAVEFRRPVPDVFDLGVANAPAAGAFPALMLNPSQDYHHLKDRRAHLQSMGYRGLRAPSSRVRGVGHMAVLFDDQSRNVAVVTPYDLDLRLVTPPPAVPFVSHAADRLDFEAAEVRVTGAALPPELLPYAAWTRVEFNH